VGEGLKSLVLEPPPSRPPFAGYGAARLAAPSNLTSEVNDMFHVYPGHIFNCCHCVAKLDSHVTWCDFDHPHCPTLLRAVKIIKRVEDKQ